MSAEEGEGSPSPPATAAEDPPLAEEAAPATKSDIESIRSKVDGELADAKTKTWQNIKMRTKMSILQVRAKIRFVHPPPTALVPDCSVAEEPPSVAYAPLAVGHKGRGANVDREITTRFFRFNLTGQDEGRRGRRRGWPQLISGVEPRRRRPGPPTGESRCQGQPHAGEHCTAHLSTVCRSRTSFADPLAPPWVDRLVVVTRR